MQLRGRVQFSASDGLVGLGCEMRRGVSRRR
jgi:hypothetical protein